MIPSGGSSGGGLPPQSAAASNTSAISFGAIADAAGNLTVLGLSVVLAIIFTGGMILLVWVIDRPSKH